MWRPVLSLKPGRRLVLALCLLTPVVTVTSSQAPPQVAKPQAVKPQAATPPVKTLFSPNLTGVWNGNDGGTYYLRQAGSAVWWVGVSADGGQRFTNVFRGTRVGERIEGEWVDVPPGSIQQAGQLALTISAAGNELRREQESGGFASSTWRRRLSGQSPGPLGGAPQTGAGSSNPKQVVKRTILPDGTVEIHYADGIIEQRSSGGVTTIFPDGRPPQRMVFVTTQGPEPPVLPSDPDVLQRWRDALNASLLSVISGMVANDPAALQALQGQESQLTVYQQINLRMKIIGKLQTRE